MIYCWWENYGVIMIRREEMIQDDWIKDLNLIGDVRMQMSITWDVLNIKETLPKSQ